MVILPSSSPPPSPPHFLLDPFLFPKNIITRAVLRIRDLLPFWPLDPDPRFEIGFSWSQIPDLGSQTHIFESSVTNFWLKSFKNKIIFNFVKFVATKKGITTNFFTPLFCFCFWIRDPGKVKIRIRDKHPGSATLHFWSNRKKKEGSILQYFFWKILEV